MQPGGVVRAEFEFRTHDEDGLLLYHQMNDPSEVRVISRTILYFQLFNPFPNDKF